MRRRATGRGVIGRKTRVKSMAWSCGPVRGLSRPPIMTVLMSGLISPSEASNPLGRGARARACALLQGEARRGAARRGEAGGGGARSFLFARVRRGERVAW